MRGGGVGESERSPGGGAGWTGALWRATLQRARRAATGRLLCWAWRRAHMLSSPQVSVTISPHTGQKLRMVKCLAHGGDTASGEHADLPAFCLLV